MSQNAIDFMTQGEIFEETMRKRVWMEVEGKTVPCLLRRDALRFLDYKNHVTAKHDQGRATWLNVFTQHLPANPAAPIRIGFFKVPAAAFSLDGVPLFDPEEVGLKYGLSKEQVISLLKDVQWISGWTEDEQ
jgi:hypothetical protein